MANLPETPQWEEGIYQIEVSDPVLGGPDGISNRQGKQLASRTLYLKQQVEKGGSDLAKHIAAADPHTQYAPKASPTFTGTPTAPTPANSDNSKKLATTEFVAKALAALAGSAPETLDTLKELADALGNDPNFATTVLNKLAEKLAKDQNGADIPDPALFVKNLGLGEAAKRNVGTGANQIPDMGSFTLSVSGTGYQKLPSGFILQWGSIGAPGIAQDVVTHFPIAFPNRCLRVLVSQDYTPDSGAVGYIACAGFSPDPVKFISRASTPGLGASFLALGC
ncbi:phage tail protein [Enterobacter roggenkampii]|uniref:gp53-like domain-containing protein n=1 Tax=Enterobacter roggenkampii TaxID=1812935 RepID=UPI0015E9308F|nr:phage tail protein [Enterobacter roggenkampii]EJP0451679.1 phage tail protein [Escherichia coli]MDG9878712.1 phage tail protein [Enterobacter roggenkampii]QMR84855.1 phage tail protein [Escherichia coli]HDX2969821.1 phage tail protein [Escherichia coli]